MQIVEVVHEVMEDVKEQLTTAANGMVPGHWTGLSPDSSAHVIIHTREKVKKLVDIFAQAQKMVDSAPGGHVSAAALTRMEATAAEQLQVQQRVNTDLRACIAQLESVKAASAASAVPSPLTHWAAAGAAASAGRANGAAVGAYSSSDMDVRP